MNVRWRQLAWLSIAELLALSLWFSASAVLPALFRECRLDAQSDRIVLPTLARERVSWGSRRAQRGASTRSQS